MSPPPAATLDDAKTRPDHEIGGRTARGFAWLAAQSIAERAIVAVSQLALAWLLLKEDFKLVTLAYTVTTFAALIQQFGLKQVLVQRFADFERLAQPAFWMSVAFGLGAGGLTFAAAEPAAAFYGEPALAGLLRVASITLPLTSVAVVPEARLVAQMRFRALAQIGFMSSVVAVGLSLGFAALGLAAYSIILAGAIAALARLIALWGAAGVPIGGGPDLSRWRDLLGDSAMLLAGSLAMMVTYQGHYVVLGRFTPGSDVLGAFYLAYTLSDQATRTLMWNLSGVLFPALSILQFDPPRQAQAFLRAVRGIMLVGIPLCFLQGVVAEPLFRLLLPPSWSVAIGPFVIFSVAMVGRLVLGTCEAMLLAQRRQRTWLAIALVYAPAFVIATVAGTWLGTTMGARITAAIGVPFGPAEGCALGVALALNAAAPVAMFCCVGPGGGRWRDVWKDYRFPLLGSAAAASAGWLAIRWLPTTRVGDAAALILAPLAMGGTYVLLVRFWARDDAYDLLGRLRGILPPRWKAALENRALRKGHALGEIAAPQGPAVTSPAE